jgi:hypothetical protein
MSADPRLTPDELAQAGRALYGDRWQTDVTHDLGLTDSARLRQWLSGKRPMPTGLRDELVGLLTRRAAELGAVAAGLAGLPADPAEVRLPGGRVIRVPGATVAALVAEGVLMKKGDALEVERTLHADSVGAVLMALGACFTDADS